MKQNFNIDINKDKNILIYVSETHWPELSTVDYLKSTVYLNLLTKSASCYCAQSLLDVSYCTRWITLILRLF